MEAFSQSVVEKIGYYVYILMDPDTGEPFYVGKGVGNRVFQHAKAALETEEPSAKLDKIRGIIKREKEVKYILARHGMSENAAFEVESALIDYISHLSDLKNKQSGHDSSERGLMQVRDVILKYDARKIESFPEPSLIIIINKEYRNLVKDFKLKSLGVKDNEREQLDTDFANKLYEKTRSCWKIGPKRDLAKFVFSVCNGIIREIYRIEKWEPKGNRWEFIGHRASDWEFYKHFLYGDVTETEFFTKGSQNPVRYVGPYPK
jgi:hypothetical protein